MTKHTGKTIPIDPRIIELVLRKHEEGKTFEAIRDQTGVSVSSQRKYLKMKAEGTSLSPKKPDHEGANNPNAKVSEDYYALLKTEIASHKSDGKVWKNSQFNAIMFEKTGIKLSTAQFAKTLKRVGATHKLFSIQYAEAET